MTIAPIRFSTANASSVSDLLEPCNAIRSGGKPARSASRSSPDVHTSRASPSSASQRTISLHRNALPA